MKIQDILYLETFSSCGDGILSALVVLDIINKSGKKLSELSAIYNPYPQKIINVRIVKKPPLNKFYSLQKIIKKPKKNLGMRVEYLSVIQVQNQYAE